MDSSDRYAPRFARSKGHKLFQPVACWDPQSFCTSSGQHHVCMKCDACSRPNWAGWHNAHTSCKLQKSPQQIDKLWQSEWIECTECRGHSGARVQILPGGPVLTPSLRMSEYEEHSPLCWKPARATFVIPPGRSDHEPCRPTGKAYGGPVSSFKATGASDALAETCHLPCLACWQALTTYQRATAAVQEYWQTAGPHSLHVQGSQLTAGPRRVTEG